MSNTAVLEFLQAHDKGMFTATKLGYYFFLKCGSKIRMLGTAREEGNLFAQTFIFTTRRRTNPKSYEPVSLIHFPGFNLKIVLTFLSGSCKWKFALKLHRRSVRALLLRLSRLRWKGYMELVGEMRHP